ncbi:putative reverse transcriptase zinc-binding domain-containing protein [Helianthus annuus]|nr:putative reverse transcriptase zinc-binding domain-containing protein [Helianthus annuus]KAJ0909893.1 putative reverse transcriptase zinc-binding domain-containing protein [Helianthus annuus]
MARFLNGTIGYRLNSFLAWRLGLDHLPTSTNPTRRSVTIGSIMCSFCGAYEESAEHLLVSCGMTQTIWDFINMVHALWLLFL